MNRTGATIELEYGSKAGDYFAEARAEMLPFVPDNCHRLLDVGKLTDMRFQQFAVLAIPTRSF